jgi:myosin heavy subunit
VKTPVDVKTSVPGATPASPAEKTQGTEAPRIPDHTSDADREEQEKARLAGLQKMLDASRPEKPSQETPPPLPARPTASRTEREEQALLQAALLEYYQHLVDLAREAAQKQTARDAYMVCLTQGKEPKVFLKERGLESPDPALVENSRLKNQNSERCGFFYPAWLYDEHANFLLFMNPEKMAQMEQEIAALKVNLAQDIQQRDRLAQERLALAAKKERMERMEKETEERLQEQTENLSKNKSKSERLNRDIRDKRDDLERHQNRVSDLNLKISSLDRKIRNEKDEAKRKDLQKEQDRIEEDRNSAEKSISEDKKEIHNMEDDHKKVERETGALQQGIPRLQEEIQEHKGKVETASEDANKLEGKLAAHLQNLRPLDALIQRREAISSVNKKIDAWWQKAGQVPRQKFLLASYVMEHFPPSCYRLNSKRWYGVGGVIEVYFW